VSERPSCIAASSHSASDVTLSQVDPLVTMMYAPASVVVVSTMGVVVSMLGVVVDGATLLVEVDGSLLQMQALSGLHTVSELPLLLK